MRAAGHDLQRASPQPLRRDGGDVVSVDEAIALAEDEGNLSIEGGEEDPLVQSLRDSYRGAEAGARRGVGGENAFDKAGRGFCDAPQKGPRQAPSLVFIKLALVKKFG